MRGSRLLNEQLFVMKPVTISAYDSDAGRNITSTTLSSVHEFMGSYQPVLRIEAPITTDFRSDVRAVMRGRVYSPNTPTLRNLLSDLDSRIMVESTGEVLTPILKPKGQGGSLNRLRTDTGDWV